MGKNVMCIEPVPKESRTKVRARRCVSLVKKILELGIITGDKIMFTHEIPGGETIMYSSHENPVASLNDMALRLQNPNGCVSLITERDWDVFFKNKKNTIKYSELFSRGGYLIKQRRLEMAGTTGIINPYPEINFCNNNNDSIDSNDIYNNQHLTIPYYNQQPILGGADISGYEMLYQMPPIENTDQNYPAQQQYQSNTSQYTGVLHQQEQMMIPEHNHRAWARLLNESTPNEDFENFSDFENLPEEEFQKIQQALEQELIAEQSNNFGDQNANDRAHNPVLSKAPGHIENPTINSQQLVAPIAKQTPSIQYTPQSFIAQAQDHSYTHTIQSQVPLPSNDNDAQNFDVQERLFNTAFGKSSAPVEALLAQSKTPIGSKETTWKQRYDCSVAQSTHDPDSYVVTTIKSMEYENMFTIKKKDLQPMGSGLEMFRKFVNSKIGNSDAIITSIPNQQGNPLEGNKRKREIGF